ncbi:MAG: glycosyltransferase family 2 protein, partial [Paraprevotella sp.]|nr:glycosyltransferase family 2 protein [Paraprevotella sp.]
MIQKTSISFIIPYYEVDGALLNRCLESLIQLDTLGLDWEAHVIDDGTPNSIAGEVVRQKNCNRIIYHRQEHTGLGEARNKGITVAQKEYIH